MNDDVRNLFRAARRRHLLRLAAWWIFAALVIGGVAWRGVL